MCHSCALWCRVAEIRFAPWLLVTLSRLLRRRPDHYRQFFIITVGDLQNSRCMKLLPVLLWRITLLWGIAFCSHIAFNGFCKRPAHGQQRVNPNQLTFSVPSGVKTFDYSITHNVVVTGGLDKLIRVGFTVSLRQMEYEQLQR